MANTLTFTSLILRMTLGISRVSPEGMVSYGVCVVRQAPVICVMAPPIHLGAWSMALMVHVTARTLHITLKSNKMGYLNL